MTRTKPTNNHNQAEEAGPNNQRICDMNDTNCQGSIYTLVLLVTVSVFAFFSKLGEHNSICGPENEDNAFCQLLVIIWTLVSFLITVFLGLLIKCITAVSSRLQRSFCDDLDEKSLLLDKSNKKKFKLDIV